MISHVEYIFVYLLAIYMSFLEEKSVPFAHSYIGLFDFLWRFMSFSKNVFWLQAPYPIYGLHFFPIW